MAPLRRRFAFALIAACTALCAPITASRAQSRFQVSAEVAAGYAGASIQPAIPPGGPNEPDDDFGGTVLGLRVGARAERFGWRVSTSRHSGEAVHLDQSAGRPIYQRVQYDLTSLDASAEWAFARAGRARWVVLGGPSFVHRATDAEEFERGGATHVGAHVGGGLELKLGRRTYLRPDARLRWIPGGDVDSTWETTVGVGWTFGAVAPSGESTGGGR